MYTQPILHIVNKIRFTHTIKRLSYTWFDFNLDTTNLQKKNIYKFIVTKENQIDLLLSHLLTLLGVLNDTNLSLIRNLVNLLHFYKILFFFLLFQIKSILIKRLQEDQKNKNHEL